MVQLGVGQTYGALENTWKERMKCGEDGRTDGSLILSKTAAERKGGTEAVEAE